MSYEFNEASHPANHAENATLNLTKISKKVLSNLVAACGGYSQVGNIIIAHAVFGQQNNSNVLTTVHAEIIIKNIQEMISEYFGDFYTKNGVESIDYDAETKKTLDIFYSLDIDKKHDEFKKNSTKDYILI